MKVRSQVILQKQRAVKSTVWLVLDKAVNEGFEGRIIAECPNEKEAKRIAAQAERIAELENILDHLYTYFYEPKDSRIDGVHVKEILKADVEKRRG